ncbi:MAG: hypothetical protein J6Z35_00890 [Lachnospiraceae bacterium]|nr:hypothetical protein [Lachnospiraceae bacterium]
MKCLYCGAILNENSTICPVCNRNNGRDEEWDDEGKQVTPSPASPDMNPVREEWKRENHSPKKKKAPVKWIIAAVAAALVLASAGILILSWESVENRIHKTFDSPEKYFKYVAEKNGKMFAKGIGAGLDGTQKQSEESGDRKVTGKVSFTLEQGGRELFRAALPEVEQEFAFIESISAEYFQNHKGEIENGNIELSLNHQPILSGGYWLNTVSGEARALVPELSDRFLGMNYLEEYKDTELLGDYTNVGKNKQQLLEKLSADNLAGQIFYRYYHVFIDYAKHVTVSDSELKVEEIGGKYTLLTVHYDKTDLASIRNILVMKIQADEDLKDLIVSYEKTSTGSEEKASKRYQKYMDRIENVLREIEKQLRSADLELYVDAKGYAVGCNIRTESTEDKRECLHMYILRDGTTGVLEIGGEEEKDKLVFRAKGEAKGKTINATCVLQYNEEDLISDEMSLSATETSHHIRPGKGILKLYQDAPEAILNGVVDIQTENKDGNESLQFTVSNGESKLFSMSFSQRTETAETVEMPQGEYVAYDRIREEYIWDVDLSKLIENLRSANVPEEWLDSLEEIQQQMQQLKELDEKFGDMSF